jgi:hypothetical protein
MGLPAAGLMQRRLMQHQLLLEQPHSWLRQSAQHRWAADITAGQLLDLSA